MCSSRLLKILCLMRVNDIMCGSLYSFLREVFCIWFPHNLQTAVPMFQYLHFKSVEYVWCVDKTTCNTTNIAPVLCRAHMWSLQF